MVKIVDSWYQAKTNPINLTFDELSSLILVLLNSELTHAERIENILIYNDIKWYSKDEIRFKQYNNIITFEWFYIKFYLILHTYVCARARAHTHTHTYHHLLRSVEAIEIRSK